MGGISLWKSQYKLTVTSAEIKRLVDTVTEEIRKAEKVQEATRAEIKRQVNAVTEEIKRAERAREECLEGAINVSVELIAATPPVNVPVKIRLDDDEVQQGEIRTGESRTFTIASVPPGTHTVGVIATTTANARPGEVKTTVDVTAGA